MRRVIADLFDSNSSRIEVHDVLSLMAFVAIIAFQVYALCTSQAFDLGEFGQAIGITLGGNAAASYGVARMRAVARTPSDLPVNKDGTV